MGERRRPPRPSSGSPRLHGSTPDVSIAGYSLGGGVGWYARKLGLAANSVTRDRARHRRRRAALGRPGHDPELFWALRGGGGNFGIVTALEIQLFAIAEVYAGVLFFPWERSSEVLHTWLEWTESVPEEMTSVGRILQFPPLPELPETLRGGKFADRRDDLQRERERRRGAPAAAPRASARRSTPWRSFPPAGIADLHMDPPTPLPYLGEGMMLGRLDGAAIDRFARAARPGLRLGADLGGDPFRRCAPPLGAGDWALETLMPPF